MLLTFHGMGLAQPGCAYRERDDYPLLGLMYSDDEYVLLVKNLPIIPVRAPCFTYPASHRLEIHPKVKIRRVLLRGTRCHCEIGIVLRLLDDSARHRTLPCAIGRLEVVVDDAVFVYGHYFDSIFPVVLELNGHDWRTRRMCSTGFEGARNPIPEVSVSIQFVNPFEMQRRGGWNFTQFR